MQDSGRGWKYSQTYAYHILSGRSGNALDLNCTVLVYASLRRLYHYFLFGGAKDEVAEPKVANERKIGFAMVSYLRHTIQE
jgi:hypothetical protein